MKIRKEESSIQEDLVEQSEHSEVFLGQINDLIQLTSVFKQKIISQLHLLYSKEIAFDRLSLRKPAKQRQNEDLEIVIELYTACQNKFTHIDEVNQFLYLFQCLEKKSQKNNATRKLKRFFASLESDAKVLIGRRYEFLHIEEQYVFWVAKIINHLLAIEKERIITAEYPRLDSKYISSMRSIFDYHYSQINQAKNKCDELLAQSNNKIKPDKIDKFIKDIYINLDEIDMKEYDVKKQENKIIFLQSLLRKYQHAKIELDILKNINSDNIKKLSDKYKIKNFYFSALLRNFSEKLIYDEKVIFWHCLLYLLQDDDANINPTLREAKEVWYKGCYSERFPREESKDYIDPFNIKFLSNELIFDLEFMSLDAKELVYILKNIITDYYKNQLKQNMVDSPVSVKKNYPDASTHQLQFSSTLDYKKMAFYRWKNHVDYFFRQLIDQIEMADELLDELGSDTNDNHENNICNSQNKVAADMIQLIQRKVIQKNKNSKKSQLVVETEHRSEEERPVSSFSYFFSCVWEGLVSIGKKILCCFCANAQEENEPRIIETKKKDKQEFRKSSNINITLLQQTNHTIDKKQQHSPVSQNNKQSQMSFKKNINQSSKTIVTSNMSLFVEKSNKETQQKLLHSNVKLSPKTFF